MFTIEFWKGAGERALKTFAQALLSGLIIGTAIVEQPWLVALGTAATATVLSLLTSLTMPAFTAGEKRPGPPDGAI